MIENLQERGLSRDEVSFFCVSFEEVTALGKKIFRKSKVENCARILLATDCNFKTQTTRSQNFWMNMNLAFYSNFANHMLMARLKTKKKNPTRRNLKCNNLKTNNYCIILN